ncbi:MAG TPA: 1-acyl-sn-glycerol-3-phosphate acyltransferase, partial [Candidatus Thermoplasmatota archaeon]|nr:1-acyl-sn-glycerol-3-phosphate acyltransferase [Candidatus Thermoplasmatota archaeon]
ARIPPGAAVVFVSNHRSNADFVVTGFMVSKSLQVSYAVGEWARVWPLEALFKSFGSYFVRRGERDPLYHRTLEAYLHLVTKQGVTQAMFPEGGLTRDGWLRPVKLGLLDMMARAKLDLGFTRPLVFVPVGINFDRVFEDENMVAEAKGVRPESRALGQRLRRLAVMVGKSSYGIPVNIVRFFAKRLKKHGVCAIHFGEPVAFDAWYARQPPFLAEPDRHARWERLRPFGEDLLGQIGRTIPATPVPVACLALRSIGRERMVRGVDRGEVILALRVAVDRLRAAGAPLFVGNPYRDRERERQERRERQASGEREELLPVSLGVGESEGLDDLLDRALDVMARRRLLHGGPGHSRDGLFRTAPERWDLVEYYANSLAAYEK